MPRATSAFRQSDITKAMKGVQAAGGSVVRVLIGKDGAIEITASPAPAKAKAENADDLKVNSVTEASRVLVDKPASPSLGRGNAK